MGTSGEIQLTAPTINSAPTMSTGTVPDAGGSGGEYFFSYDFNDGATFTFTGDFNEFFGSEASSYSDLSDPSLPGAFNLNTSDGSFTYTVTATQISNSGLLNHSLVVEGDFGGFADDDTINLTFVLCFAAGTGIAAPMGERKVEALSIGDPILTADGRTVPVKWIGRTSINPMFNPADRLEPVCIARGALGRDMPNRDLIVTSDHGMILDDLVINAGALVGGDGIDWYPWKAFGQSLTYYHIETEAHDVILANGAPAETFIDYAGRQMFENFAEYQALYGAERTIPEMDRPRISARRLLPDAIRQRLRIPDDADAGFDDLQRMVG